MMVQYVIRIRIEAGIGNNFNYWYQNDHWEITWNGIKENATKMSYGESRSVMHELVSKNSKIVYHREEIRE